MKTILVLGRKHIPFNPAKHTIIAGNLCHFANPLKIIGRITRCYSGSARAPRAATAAPGGRTPRAPSPAAEPAAAVLTL